MAELSDFLPIRVEDLDSIIARIDADVNAGIDPSDDAFIDTTPGTFYADIRTAIALELERLWDVATADTVAASLVEYAWGDYLDAHGATLTLPRREAVAATGEVTFTGDEGTVIGTGTEVSTIQTSAETEAVGFETTEAGTIPSSETLTLPVRALEDGAVGNVATGAIELVLSPITGIASITNESAITGGADIENDDAYRERIKLAWSAAQGAGSVADYERWALSDASIGFVRVTPIWNGPGTVLVVVTDVENNPLSDEVVTALQNRLDPYDAETKTSGVNSGTTINVDSTDGFADAGLIYVGERLVEYSGKTASSFTGVDGLSGSVTDDTPVIQSGTGRGLAPVGAIVTVKTAQTVVVDVAAELVLEDGYSIDSDSGEIGVGEEITAILTSYINSLPPGADGAPGVETGEGFILLNRLASLILRVPGVYDLTLSALEIDGANVDFVVGKFQVPEVGTITLTEA